MLVLYHSQLPLRPYPPSRPVRNTSNPGHELNQSPQPKCSNECNIAKRNAKLADALRINVENREKVDVVYADELVGFASVNMKFFAFVEKAFVE
jgi:transcriptional repressor NF-X1